MKLTSALLVAFLLTFSLSCGAATDGPGGGSASGALTVFGNDPTTLDPALASDVDSSVYVVELFSGLATLNQSLQIVPDLAESWDISQDGKTYTFKIRSNAKFHDGRKVTAQDFKYSFERAADPSTQSPVADTYLGDIVGVREKLGGATKEVSGVKAVDESTLTMQLEAARYYFLAKMTYPTSFVVDKANVESGKTWTDKPNGTGPFKLKEWTKGTKIVLARNADYYNEPAKIQEVNYLLAGGSAMTMYENNEVDITGIGVNDIDRISDPSNPLNKELVISPEFSVGYVGFNQTMPPFDDPKVRKAFSAAIDKDQLIRVLLKNMVKKADGIIPAGMPGHNPSVRGIKFDPAAAKQELASSKYAGNLPPIRLTVASSTSQISPFVEALLEMWKTNLGVTLTVQQVEPAIFFNDIRRNPAQNKTNKYSMYVLGWVADYPDPQDFIDILFYSKSLDNSGSYSNPEVDKFIEQARSEPNTDKRFQLYQQAEQLIVNDAAWIPLDFGQAHTLVKPRVKGYTPAPFVIPHMKYISLQ